MNQQKQHDQRVPYRQTKMIHQLLVQNKKAAANSLHLETSSLPIKTKKF